jgi:hypothetical protein
LLFFLDITDIAMMMKMIIIMITMTGDPDHTLGREVAAENGDPGPGREVEAEDRGPIRAGREAEVIADVHLGPGLIRAPGNTLENDQKIPSPSLCLHCAMQI